MEPGLIWILAGILLLGAELLLPGAFLMWIGLAAVATGAVVWAAQPPFYAVVLLFLALLAAAIGAGLRFWRGQDSRRWTRLNRPEAGLAGRTGIVLAVEPGGLRVRVGDSDWAARLPQAGVAPGQTVRVDAVDGTLLVVSPLPDAARPENAPVSP
jgi:membrane protein implicated in regulation of membrane protease activity